MMIPLYYRRVQYMMHFCFDILILLYYKWASQHIDFGTLWQVVLLTLTIWQHYITCKSAKIKGKNGLFRLFFFFLSHLPLIKQSSWSSSSLHFIAIIVSCPLLSVDCRFSVHTSSLKIVFFSSLDNYQDYFLKNKYAVAQIAMFIGRKFRF